MTGKIKRALAIAFSLAIFSLPMLVPSVASAVCGSDNIQSGIATGIDNATGGNTGCGTTDIKSGIQSLATKIVNILSIVVGVVAIIMIIYGGFRYITSGGESGNVSGAKNTLLFAIVGLVIVALAQVIVHWVLGTATSISGFIHF